MLRLTMHMLLSLLQRFNPQPNFFFRNKYTYMLDPCARLSILQISKGELPQLFRLPVAYQSTIIWAWERLARKFCSDI